MFVFYLSEPFQRHHVILWSMKMKLCRGSVTFLKQCVLITSVLMVLRL